MEESLKRLFQERFGAPAGAFLPLPADGSNRRLVRLTGSGRSVIGAYGPDASENRAFLGFSRHFRAAGLPVPEILAERTEDGVYLEEDLGDTTLFQFLTARRGASIPQDVLAVYEKAVRLLPKFQVTGGKGLDYGLCYPRASFDRQSMLWDLNHFKYFFLRLAKVPFEEQALEDDFQRFADYLLEADRDYFLYRDFQSRNIMVRDGSPWFIDYQGGRKGALQYDIASLLYDAKADLPPEVRRRLLETYLDALSELVPLDRKKFKSLFQGFVLIRIMQAMGTYGLRGFFERKAHFLKSIPYAIHNLEQLLRESELPVPLPALGQVFRRLIASGVLRQFGGASLRLTVRVSSFSYLNGMPQDDKGHGGGFVFDCRGLPNPGKHAEYAPLTGMDAPVIAFLEAERDVKDFMEHVGALVERSVLKYQSRNFTDLMVSFGCTGGRHRSVYCAELLAKRLREKTGVAVELRHREQGDVPR